MYQFAEKKGFLNLSSGGLIFAGAYRSLELNVTAFSFESNCALRQWESETLK